MNSGCRKCHKELDNKVTSQSCICDLIASFAFHLTALLGGETLIRNSLRKSPCMFSSNYLEYCLEKTCISINIIEDYVPLSLTVPQTYFV